MPGRHQLHECGGLFRIFCQLPHAHAEARRHRLRNGQLFGKHAVGAHLRWGGFLRGRYQQGMLSLRLRSRVRMQVILHHEH